MILSTLTNEPVDFAIAESVSSAFKLLSSALFLMFTLPLNLLISEYSWLGKSADVFENITDDQIDRNDQVVTAHKAILITKELKIAVTVPVACSFQTCGSLFINMSMDVASFKLTGYGDYSVSSNACSEGHTENSIQI